MRTILTALFMTLATLASAKDDDPFGVTLYGSFLHTDTVPNALFFFNEIKQYDGFELRRALRNHDIDTVVLASDGGNVFEGLNMAGIIHDKGIITYVPELPEKMGCYSACALMFFGGKIRQADGVLAVHQAGSYGSDRDKTKEKVSDTQQATQFTVSEIIGFLNEFETPPWVYEKMFRSREFYEFDADEKMRLALRIDEINSKNLYTINAFINSYSKYRKDTNIEEKKKVKEIEKEPELSEEELRLVVVEIQKLLNAAGCNAGVADGIWGRRTQAAATLFARTAKLPEDEVETFSEVFVKKLRSAGPNFCPKPKKPNNVKSQFTITCSDHNNVGTLTINFRKNATSFPFTLTWSLFDNLVVKGKLFNISKNKAYFQIGSYSPQIVTLTYSSKQIAGFEWYSIYSNGMCRAKLRT